MPCPECNTDEPPRMPPGLTVTTDDKGRGTERAS